MQPDVITDTTPVAAIILAAGKSTRMRSKLPKMLHPVCGLPVTQHVIRACYGADIARVVVVVGHEAETVKAGLGDSVEYALQTVQRGTGDAVKAAAPLLQDWPGTIVVLVGDIPLLQSAALTRLLEHHHRVGADLTLLTAILDDPTGYGRILRDEQGRVARIVEQRDASPDELAIAEINPSLYAFRASALWPALAALEPNNAQGEFYLTDSVAVLNRQGRRVEGVAVADARDVLGINNRVELAQVAAILRQRLLTDLMLSGVTITDPATTYVDVDVRVGQDTVIEPNTHLARGTRIGDDCHIGPNTRIERSILGNHTHVLASYLADSVVGNGVKIGPFANLRAGTVLEDGVKIGDFVETKNATLHAGAQASHLAYIGDAEIGAKTNIGAGAITCNYDGYQKHRTIVGERAFIGSNSTLVAPVTIGDGAFVAAGSPVTRDVPPDALHIARPEATVKEGWAARYHQRKQQEKSQQKGNETL